MKPEHGIALIIVWTLILTALTLATWIGRMLWKLYLNIMTRDDPR